MEGSGADDWMSVVFRRKRRGCWLSSNSALHPHAARVGPRGNATPPRTEPSLGAGMGKMPGVSFSEEIERRNKICVLGQPALLVAPLYGR